MVGVAAQLNTSRQALLDLSTRNRLLNIPRRSKNIKTIEVIGESSVEVFRLLVKEGKALSFLPAREADGDVPDEDGRDKPSQPEGDGADDSNSSKRDSRRLQTLLSSERLQKRLLSLFYDAKTLEEEQGVNILYLAMGVLKWFEDDNSDVEHYAPLILVPVSLERGSANERFKLRWRDEDITANLSLQAKMKADFGLVIPDLSEDDELDVSVYLSAVQSVVSAKKRFEVKENDIVLGFFSFAKFLMYRDLDAANWPEFSKLDTHPLIMGLLGDGFPAVEGMISEDAQVDEYLTSTQMLHVVDADSSQTLAIEEVRRGRNLVIQGPPGTGKSQTITNIIASAVANGKKVLFVSEKMAALEVVKRRMDTIGLGPLCLELHSHKANKRGVLEELKRTRELASPSYAGNQDAAKLQLLRDKLNKYVAVLHTPLQPSGLTAFQIIGHLVRLEKAGVDAQGIILDNPRSWSADDKKDREELLADITARIRDLGIPAHHPWRGVCRRQLLLPNEYERFCDTLMMVRQTLDLILADVAIVERTFPSATTSLDTLNTANATVNAVLTLPYADYTSLTHPLWQNGMPLLIELVQSGERYANLKQKLTGIITDTAWSINLKECRQQIATHGGSLLRFLHTGYRRALTLLKSLLTVPLPKKQVEQLALMDDIITVQNLEQFLHQYHEAGRAAFGYLWQGTQSKWPNLVTLVAWRSRLPPKMLSSNFLQRCARITSIDEWRNVAMRLQQQVPEFFTRLAGLYNDLQLDVQIAFAVPAIEAVDRQALADRLTLWIENSESLSKWLAFKGKHQDLQAAGMGSIADKLWRGSLALDKVKAIFERAYFGVLAEEIFTSHPQLREFDGDQHNRLVANFREADHLRIKQARIEIRSKHYANMPRVDTGIGTLGVLSGEFAKKRNHLPIRKLMKRAGAAIQALKPVFMMSPLSVAQFLEPGALQFDLLVMDEASQVEPVDALGAIARTRQIVVVGDEHQLPPTQFFSHMTTDRSEEDDNDDDYTLATHDVESILNLCLARGLPQRMLRWHYRSKHPSLIAVSNKQFYGNRLFIVPSPYYESSNMGLVFHHLPKATFDSGGTRTNSIEAKAVADAVIRHAKEYPTLSLGVGAFSVKQQQAILDEVELARRSHPDTEHFFTQAHQDEPFFVKNLENIQGDERDVIFISVGYGRNQSGYLAMRFGPLNAEGGERRLNVLISRAKHRCEVFSSMTADDIDLERGKGAGVLAFKLFLKFAQTGNLDFGQATDRKADSVFEEQVAAALRAKGYDVKTQIGTAGFFIDLAIVDADKPGRYLIGIECDGASYHSSRSARDRDRLRQTVLEDHGWIIHRIWSTDWFRKPKEQLEKTILAIEEAKLVHKTRGQQIVLSTASKPVEIVASLDDRVIDPPTSLTQKKLAVPYKEADFRVPTYMEPHTVSNREMAGIVEKIIEIEGPIHIEEIVARVRILWNRGRAGERIHNKVEFGLNLAMSQGAVKQEGPFYFKPMADIPVRDRSGVSSPGLRKPESLPPQEIKKAILMLVKENYGLSRDQLPVEVARLFGFKATSAQLRDAIEKQIEVMLSSKSLQNMGGHITASVKRD